MFLLVDLTTFIQVKYWLKMLGEKLVLKEKLASKFKRIHFFVRFSLVLIWFGVLSGFYFFGLIGSLCEALNYSEASILLIIVINFLTFGTISNLNNYIDLIKVKTENWVYGKYIDLDSKIDSNRIQLSNLSDEIKGV